MSVKLFRIFSFRKKRTIPKSDISKKINQQIQHESLKTRQVAPGTKIYYHEGLINKLENDHQDLLKVFAQILQAFENEDIKLLKRLLTKFKSLINDHFLLENIKLYIYLKNVLKKDVENYKIMLLFQKEITEIGSAVMKFIDNYVKSSWTSEDMKSFSIDVEAIGDALVTRIRREEDVLYPLYMPPDAY